MGEPELTTNNWSWLDVLVGPIDEDFASAVTEKPEEQERLALDFFG